jgi:hypothetical protein
MALARSGASVLVLLLVGGALIPNAAMRQTRDGGATLTTLFVPGGIVRDTNSDNIPDAVGARIVVPASPTVREIQAAANIAARLGFETSALTLPLVVRDADVTADDRILILLGGSNAWVTKLGERSVIDLKGLQRGQGLIAAVPSPAGAGRAVVVAGPDDKGTLAAANEFASRLPRLWNMTGITLAGIEDQTAKCLKAHGVDATQPALASVIVDAERRGLAQVTVRFAISASQVERAARALAELDDAHRRGMQPQTLNFAEAAAIAVDLVADGRTSRAIVRRAGLNSSLTPPIDPTSWRPTLLANAVKLPRLHGPRPRPSISRTRTRSRDVR